MSRDDSLTYFLHIPKTAGTSATSYFYDACNPDSIAPHRTWDTLITATPTQLRQWRVYIGHFAGALPLWLHSWPRTVTIVRNPAARVISAIKHVKRSPQHPLYELASSLSVAEYCRHPVLGLSVENMQARYLASLTWAQALTLDADVNGRPTEVSTCFHAGLHALERGRLLEDQALNALECLDAVGIAEELSTTLRLFSKTLAVPEPATDYRLNEASAREHADLKLSDEDHAAVEAVTEVDSTVYKRGLQLFHMGCEQFELCNVQQP